jgi:hypothetical protein
VQNPVEKNESEKDMICETVYIERARKHSKEASAAPFHNTAVILTSRPVEVLPSFDERDQNDRVHNEAVKEQLWHNAKDLFLRSRARRRPCQLLELPAMVFAQGPHHTLHVALP